MGQQTMARDASLLEYVLCLRRGARGIFSNYSDLLDLLTEKCGREEAVVHLNNHVPNSCVKSTGHVV